MSVISSDVPAPVYPRRHQTVFGTAFAAAGLAMVQLTLVGLYVSARAHNKDNWFKEQQTALKLSQPNMIFFTLVMGSVAVSWAVWAINRNERGQAAWALGITTLLGVAVINQTWFLYSQAGVKLSGIEGKYFYGATGFHLALVAGATIFILLMTVRSFGNSFSRRYPDGLTAAALLWHVAVLLYVPIWIGIYIAK